MKSCVIYLIDIEGKSLAYLCKGVMVDNLRKLGYKLTKTVDDIYDYLIKDCEGQDICIRSSTLKYPSDNYLDNLDDSIEYILEQDLKKINTWSIVGPATDDLIEDDTVLLNVKQYAKFELPTKVYIERDIHGELFTRIRVHPECDGLLDKGKLFFPDKEWTDASEGEANITYIDELASYGFMKGSLEVYKLPDIKSLIEYTCMIYNAMTWIVIIGGSIHGDYACIFNADDGEYRRIHYDSGGYLTDSSYYPVCNDINDYTVWYGTNIELLLKFIYNKDVSLDEFMNKFFISDFSPLNGKFERKLVQSWKPVLNLDYTGYSELFIRFINSGLVTANFLVRKDIILFDITKENLLNIYSFTSKELDMIAEEMSKYNLKTENYILNEIKKGKLQLLSLIE